MSESSKKLFLDVSESQEKSHNLGLILNVASMLVMSLGPILNKFAVLTIPALMAAFLSLVFATFFSLIYSRVNRERLSFPNTGWMGVIGLLNGVAVICLFQAQSNLNPIMIGFMGRFYVVFTTLLSVFCLRERASQGEWVLMAIAVGSSFMLNFKGVEGSSSIGILLILLQTFLFATVNMIVKTKLGGHHPNNVLFYNNLVSALVVSILLWFSGNFASLQQLQLGGLGWLALSSFVASFLGLLLFYKGIQHLRFSDANLIRALAPISTALFSLPFFPIKMSVVNLLGAGTMVAAVVGMSWIKFKSSRR